MANETYLLGRNAVAYFNSKEILIGDSVLGDVNVQISGEPASHRKIEIWRAVNYWLNADGSVAKGNKVEATNCVDVSLNISSEFADASTRETASTGFEARIPVLRGGEVTFEARYKPDIANSSTVNFTQALMNAWEGDERIGMVFLDQQYATPSVGENDIVVQGLAANFSVSMSKTEALRDVQRMSVTLTIADTALWYREEIDAATP